MLCTLFSASNYCNSDNQGAYITIFSHLISDAYPIRDSGLFYEVNRYKTSHAPDNLHKSNKTSLIDLLMRKKVGLKAAFEAADTDNNDMVSRSEWADIMQRVTNIKIRFISLLLSLLLFIIIVIIIIIITIIRWLSIISTIAPVECLSSSNNINYKIFLNSLTFSKNDMANAEAMDAMYAQRRKLETVFYFFDSNNDGVISREEFHKGCEVINSSLPEDSTERLTDIDHMLGIIIIITLSS
jgi:Ca2+-binding EF-hand superfamily protein